MEYTRLGNTGLLVSRLSCGTMTFGEGKGPMRRFDLDAATQVVNECIDAGINSFNTAATYGAGRSEEILGQALGDRRADVVITTKVFGPTGKAPIHRGLSRRHVLEALDGSLRRLGTDYVDVYIAHHYDTETPLEETLDAFDTAVRSGKARYIGFSNWPAWAAAKAVGIQQRNGWHQFRACELYYSLLGRDIETEIVPFCQDAGIGIMPWSPLAMGFLSGRYTRGDLSEQAGRFTSFDGVPPFDLDHAHDVMDVVREIAAEVGASPAQVALAWVLGRPQVASVLVGMSSLEQLHDNLRAAEVELSDDHLERLDALTAPPPQYPIWLQQGMAAREARQRAAAAS